MEPITEPRCPCGHRTSFCPLLIESSPSDGWTDRWTDSKVAQNTLVVSTSERRDRRDGLSWDLGVRLRPGEGCCAHSERFSQGCLSPHPPSAWAFCHQRGGDGDLGESDTTPGSHQSPRAGAKHGTHAGTRRGHDPAGTGVMPPWIPPRRRVPAEDVDTRWRPG